MTNSKPKAVVLVSGGMDSLVTAAIANEHYELCFMHLNYGQRTQKRELESFNRIADYFNVKDRFVVDIKYLSEIGGSSLTDENIEVSAADLNRKDIPTSYVPFRNANILSIAVSWAESIGAGKIFIGAVEDDSSGYPDCREIFYKAFNEVIKLGTRPETDLEIITPLIHMRKHEIVIKGSGMKVPFELSWSCYKNEDIACGECDSCALRLRGFYMAGIDDPLEYLIKPEVANILNKINSEGKNEN